jgi:dTDP-4-amino-4,6-dideoxygalactose transaminase
LYQKVKLLRNHGLKNNISQISGYNSRLDNIQAAVANIKLSKIKKRIVITRKYADIYNKILKYLVQVPLYNKNEKPVFHRYIILCQNKKERDTLYHFLKQKGIETKINYGTPLYDHPAYKTFKYKKLSTAESIGKRMLSLPLYPEISQNELNHVIRSIKSFFRKAL